MNDEGIGNAKPHREDKKETQIVQKNGQFQRKS